MIIEIIKELTAMNDMSSVMSEQVLAWARRIQVQAQQTSTFDSLKENKIIDEIKSQPYRKTSVESKIS